MRNYRIIDISKNGHRNWNFSSEPSIDPYKSLADLLEWASFCGFTHYRRDGKCRPIPKKYRFPA